eukprot:GHVR01188768.1.p1 GENE.GHVR01188768.1~~GHVR01188768.1.p1  ORF type:complete len:198 (+),score=8.06 GHVR01188768.1:370-963(+)
MNISILCEGTSPILMHNPRMVDPQYEINREIKAFTSKRKKTDDDLKAIERFEWYGGLYTAVIDGKEVITQPTSKLRKCLINTARTFKLGKAVERSLSFKDLNVPLIHDGPASKDELFKEERFHSRLSVGIGQKRVMRVRPQFSPWAMEVRGFFVEDAGLNFSELLRIIEMAGIIEGIGDNRVNGYGRFVTVVKEEKG